MPRRGDQRVGHGLALIGSRWRDCPVLITPPVGFIQDVSHLDHPPGNQLIQRPNGTNIRTISLQRVREVCTAHPALARLKDTQHCAYKLGQFVVARQTGYSVSDPIGSGVIALYSYFTVPFLFAPARISMLPSAASFLSTCTWHTVRCPWR